MNEFVDPSTHSCQTLTSLLDACGSGAAFVLSTEGRVEANGAFREAFGILRNVELTIDELRARLTSTRTWPDDAPPVVEALFDRRATQGFECLLKTESQRIVEVRATALERVLPGLRGHFLHVHDVTPLWRRCEALERERDRAVEETNAKSLFLASMSHEIRTPMNGVLGMTDLLSDTALDSEQYEYVQMIRASGRSLLTIINDILDLSKIEAGKLALETIDLSLADLVDEVLELLSDRAQRKGIALEAIVHPDAVKAWRGDPTRLRQVLTNLVGNAVKFTEAGHVVLRVQAPLEVGRHRVQLRFECEDTGIGIPEGDLVEIFQPFVQTGDAVARRGGTGLGLVISRQLVGLMGGTIDVRSVLGQGTTFRFDVEVGIGSAPVAPGILLETETPCVFLPATALVREKVRSLFADPEQGIVETTPEGLRAQDHSFGIFELDPADTDASDRFTAVLDACPTMRWIVVGDRFALESRARGRWPRSRWVGCPRPLRRATFERCLERVLGRESVNATLIEAPRARLSGRVLLAEDHPINQKLALKLLERLGCGVTVVGDGRQAVEACRDAAFDLVLMDCQMPELDGFEATRQIRALEGPMAEVPIVALTAQAMLQDRERCLASGMNDHIGKPIDALELEDKLRTWLGDRS